MIYVLIAIIFSTNSGSPASVTAEFNDKQSCIAAATELSKQVRAGGAAFNDKILYCTPKGEKK